MWKRIARFARPRSAHSTRSPLDRPYRIGPLAPVIRALLSARLLALGNRGGAGALTGPAFLYPELTSLFLSSPTDRHCSARADLPQAPHRSTSFASAKRANGFAGVPGHPGVDGQANGAWRLRQRVSRSENCMPSCYHGRPRRRQVPLPLGQVRVHAPGPPDIFCPADVMASRHPISALIHVPLRGNHSSQ